MKTQEKINVRDLTVQELIEMGADIHIHFHNHDEQFNPRSREQAKEIIEPFGTPTFKTFDGAMWFSIEDVDVRISSYFGSDY